MPERADHRRHRAHRPGRPPAFDPAAYKRRNVVERCVNRLKQFRALATRYDKTAAAYQALVTFRRPAALATQDDPSRHALDDAHAPPGDEPSHPP